MAVVQPFIKLLANQVGLLMSRNYSMLSIPLAFIIAFVSFPLLNKIALYISTRRLGVLP